MELIESYGARQVQAVASSRAKVGARGEKKLMKFVCKKTDLNIFAIHLFEGDRWCLVGDRSSPGREREYPV